MKHRYRFSISLAALAFASALSWAGTPSTQFPSRQNNEGMVMVSVTPQSLGTGDKWVFAVQFNTHVKPITQDLQKVSVLIDSKGHQEQALAWQGDPPGGHHRHGFLVFRPMTPKPALVTLMIGQVGGVAERSFTWSLPAD